LLYGYSPGLPFFIEAIICGGACLVLLLPPFAKEFYAARQKFTDEDGLITESESEKEEVSAERA
jgi:hypothetical protein